jgi:hypothetical protein
LVCGNGAGWVDKGYFPSRKHHGKRQLINQMAARKDEQII